MRRKYLLLQNNSGFTLIELVVGLALLLSLQAVCYIPFQHLYHNYKEKQLEIACRLLLDDLATLQTTAYYASTGRQTYTLALAGEGDGYNILGPKGSKRVSFAAVGLGEFKLEGNRTTKFLPGGTPEQTASLHVVSRTDNTLKRIIYIQPVTGRVVVENE